MKRTAIFANAFACVKKCSPHAAKSLPSTPMNIPKRSSSALCGRSDAVDRHLRRLRGDKRELLFLDGGTGEELSVRGVPDDRKLWSATAVVNEQYHPILEEVHRSFLDAGSDVITTNSYGVTPGVGFGLEDVAKYVAIAGEIARRSIPSSRSGTALVLGSLGPLVESYRPDLIMEHGAGVNAYSVFVKALHPNVDAFLAETMSSCEESCQAVEAVANLSPDYQRPMLVSYTLQSDGAVRSGEPVCEALIKLINCTTEKKVELIGVLFNCCEPEAITTALHEIKSNNELTKLLHKKGILLGAYANRLTPVDPNWTLANSSEAQPMRDDLGPQEYETIVLSWVRRFGIQMIGGCCGITPEHISYLRSHLSLSERD